MALDLPCGVSVCPGSYQVGSKPLVGTISVVMLDKSADRQMERSLTEHDHSIETLLLDRANESLGEGVAVGVAPASD